MQYSTSSSPGKRTKNGSSRIEHRPMNTLYLYTYSYQSLTESGLPDWSRIFTVKQKYSFEIFNFMTGYGI